MKIKNWKHFPPHPTQHGGSLAHKKRKNARPISVRRSMHVVLRSTRARGSWSLGSRDHRLEIDVMVKKFAKRYSVKVYRYANVGNHVHFLLKVRKRENLSNFLRVLTQAVAFLVTGTRKGNPIGKFWDALAFSRIVDWGDDWENMLVYLEKNQLEGAGFPRDRVDNWFTLATKIKRELQRI